jgi:hypothetical protein
MRRPWVPLLIFLVCLIPAPTSSQLLQTPDLPLMFQTPRCPGIRALWSHVYRRERFEIRNRCAVVTGVVAAKRSEPDGDRHIRVTVDAEFESLLNDKNRTAQHGDLVVEPICVRAVTQPSAQGFCNDFQSTVPNFPVGTRVRVKGPYVLDKEHGWMEIHPVHTMTEIQ